MPFCRQANAVITVGFVACLTLQRYFWFKKKNPVWTAEHPFPRDVEYLMFDTLELLRPKLQMCTSWDEASQAADALDKEFTSKFGELFTLRACQAVDDVDDDEEEDDNKIAVCRVIKYVWLCFMLCMHTSVTAVSQVKGSDQVTCC